MGLYNISYKNFTSRLIKIGFQLNRQAKGSHEIWYNPENNQTFCVPRHSDTSISIGIIKKFLRMVDLSINEFHNI